MAFRLQCHLPHTSPWHSAYSATSLTCRHGIPPTVPPPLHVAMAFHLQCHLPYMSPWHSAYSATSPHVPMAFHRQFNTRRRSISIPQCHLNTRPSTVPHPHTSPWHSAHRAGSQTPSVTEAERRGVSAMPASGRECQEPGGTPNRPAV